MSSDDLNDRELETLFSAARQAKPAMSTDFLDRLQQDAEQALQPRLPAAPASPATGFWTSFRAAVGGWGGVGGLATATVAGFWIGISPPELISTSADVLTLLDSGNTVLDSWFSLSDMDLLLSEEL